MIFAGSFAVVSIMRVFPLMSEKEALERRVLRCPGAGWQGNIRWN